MTQSKVFEHRSVISASTAQIMAFHEDPRALSWLTMPPTFLQVLRDNRTSLTSGEIEFNLWLGPLPVRWVARHEAGPIPTSFFDRMLQGPMDRWEHQHMFVSVPGGTELVDRITLAHKPGIRGLLTRLVFDGLPLRILFIYRHWRTKRIVLAGAYAD
jgi:ligand-binding SRPBCC domain-containing protein